MCEPLHVLYGYDGNNDHECNKHPHIDIFFVHTATIYVLIGNVNRPGVPCERQRHAGRRDQIFDPGLQLYKLNASNVNNTMDDLGGMIIKLCLGALAFIAVMVLVKSVLVACGVLVL